jgi:hypothetical protein
MAMYDKNPDETIYMRILNLNTYDVNYWSNLINYARLLMSKDERAYYKLEKMIYNFRRILCENQTPDFETFVQMQDKEKEELQIPPFWLIQLTTNSIDDYTSYFKTQYGEKITRPYLEGELENIKEYIFQYLAERKSKIRFTQVQP